MIGSCHEHIQLTLVAGCARVFRSCLSLPGSGGLAPSELIRACYFGVKPSNRFHHDKHFYLPDGRCQIDHLQRCNRSYTWWGIR